jgi:hypothetical protein
MEQRITARSDDRFEEQAMRLGARGFDREALLIFLKFESSSARLRRRFSV